MDDIKKEYDMAHSRHFTQKMIQKYPTVFTGIGKLECTVNIDLQGGTTHHQAGT